MRHTLQHPPLPPGSTRRGNVPLVLFALEPRAYSEAIAQTVADLRPGLEVLAVGPDGLAAEVRRRTPSLVLCARPRPDGRAGAVRWVEYRPYEDPEAVRVDGREERRGGSGLNPRVTRDGGAGRGRPRGAGMVS